MNKRVVFTFLSAAIIVGGTVIAIRYGQGYRPTSQGMLAGTGLLAANSFPNGASVYINGELRTATDTTLNLSPGQYEIEIRKDGYTTWKKTIHLENELVSQTNAVLFPTAPSLSPLTFTGAANLTPSPDGQQLLFTTASASSSRANGIYVMDLTDSPLALQKGPRQIARTPAGTDLSKAEFFWSPDASQILVSQSNKTLLLTSNRMNELETSQDVTARRAQIISEWKDQSEKKFRQALSRFPVEFVAIATSSAKNIYISPDQDRILYTATASITIPEDLLPKVPAANSQPEQRAIEPGKTYVYDRHEDRNFLVFSSTQAASPTPTPKIQSKKTSSSVVPPIFQIPNPLDDLIAMRDQTSGFFTRSPQWLPDSKHVILVTDKSIEIVEYDGTNQTKIYVGPFFEQFAYPWPNGSKLIILTNFNQLESSQYNLYAVGLR